MWIRCKVVAAVLILLGSSLSLSTASNQGLQEIITEDNGEHTQNIPQGDISTRQKQEDEAIQLLENTNTIPTRDLDMNPNFAEFETSDLDELLGHIQSKRFLSLFRTRPVKTEGFKRGPGFRSWGGKRGKFSNWGGKRAEDEEQDISREEKRQAEYAMPFEQYQKRTKPFFDGKRRPFQSWGGKRNMVQGPLYFHQPDWRKVLSWEGKRKFSSWGGKRSNIDGDFNEGADDLISEIKRGDEPQRKKQSFKSWGGKRSTDNENDLSSPARPISAGEYTN